jgi:hypothetical protein
VIGQQVDFIHVKDVLVCLRKNAGSKASVPCFIAFSTSKLPTTRSSVAPRGRSTTTMSFSSVGSFVPFLESSMHAGHMLEGSSGLQLNGQFLITLIFGRTSAKERTIVLFPEPFGPLMSKPPIFGLIAFIKMASLSLSKPTIEEKGRTSRFLCAGNSDSQHIRRSTTLLGLAWNMRARLR